MTFCERLAQHFQAHPREWVDGHVLMTLGGSFAFRTRISELRRAPWGMDIQNRVRVIRKHADTCPRSETWGALQSEHPYTCNCKQSKHYTVTEYQSVPREPAKDLLELAERETTAALLERG